jgi:proteasome lid subunit RPN8/RPN11
MVASLMRRLEQEAMRAYPKECCGILIGRETGDGRRVERIEPASNESAKDEQHHRFLISPRELLAVEKAAARDGVIVLGFYHSHPDAPARPSEYDREHAWPFYSYVIVSVAQGQALDATSWVLNEESRLFSRQEIEEV